MRTIKLQTIKTNTKMKRSRILITVIALAAITLTGLYAQNRRATSENVKFDVNMTCGDCVKKIEKNIAFERGVTDMNVDLASRTVNLTYNTRRTDVNKLQAGFAKIGYTATVASEKDPRACCSGTTAAAPAACGDKKEGGCCKDKADAPASCGDKKEGGCCKDKAEGAKSCGDKKEGGCCKDKAEAPKSCGEKKEGGCCSTKASV